MTENNFKFLNKSYADRIAAKNYPFLYCGPGFIYFSMNDERGMKFNVDWSTFDGDSVMVNQ